MKQIIDVTTWEECLDHFRQIASETDQSPLPLYFRGQSDANWDLATSLERRCPNRQISLLSYYKLILSIEPEVKAFTQSSWAAPESKDLEVWANSYDDFRGLKSYDYLVYLRHHNFPSPLLDWTASPYIAAYFAFASAKSDAVAIYVYCERPNNLKRYSSDEPMIWSHGPVVHGHKRHFRQQSSYTVCLKFEVADGWSFYSHQDLLEHGVEGQDVVWKIVIPTSEREKVLQTLNRYNLTAFSLFDTEEALMETLSIRMLDLPRSWALTFR